VFRILQDKLRQAWSDHLAAGVIATCPVVELEFLYSARSLADRLEKQRLLHELFGWVPMYRVLYVVDRDVITIERVDRVAAGGPPASDVSGEQRAVPVPFRIQGLVPDDRQMTSYR